MAIMWIKICFAVMLSASAGVAYTLPKPRIEVLHPRGFLLSIPDSPGIQAFSFHGNLNLPMAGLENGQIAAEVLKHKSGRWTFVDRKHEIKPGDVLYYWLYVQKDSLGYRRDDQKHIFTDADVYGASNITEETTTEPLEPTDRPNRAQSSARGNENCNASTPPVRVFPQEVHHFHHHDLLGVQGGCTAPNGGTNYNRQQSTNPQDAATIKQMAEQIRQLTVALENMKLKVSTLSDVVDELINSNSNTKLVLTGAQIDSSTNLFELVRHVVLDKLELKDLKNDIYSATRTKNGIVFDVASGLDKRRILARARERFGDDDELRIQDYYDEDAKGIETTGQIVDVRFGGFKK